MARARRVGPELRLGYFAQEHRRAAPDRVRLLPDADKDLWSENHRELVALA